MPVRAVMTVPAVTTAPAEMPALAVTTARDAMTAATWEGRP